MPRGKANSSSVTKPDEPEKPTESDEKIDVDQELNRLPPLIYGRGPTPAGMAMMPMLLPDGRIGYVLQQSGVQPQTSPSHKRGGRNGGGSSSKNVGSSSKGRHGNDDGQGRRYRPY